MFENFQMLAGINFAGQQKLESLGYVSNIANMCYS